MKILAATAESGMSSSVEGTGLGKYGVGGFGTGLSFPLVALPPPFLGELGVLSHPLLLDGLCHTANAPGTT